MFKSNHTITIFYIPKVFESSDCCNGRTVNDVTTVIQHMKINSNLPNLQNAHVHVHVTKIASKCNYHNTITVLHDII
jgi:hypothetical protein